VHRLLHKACGDAVKLRLVRVNPASGINVPAARPAERSLWTPEQVSSFVAACSEYTTYYDPLWLFLLGSGCRIGEALALREEHIDWNRSQVGVKRAVGHVGNVPYEDDPKTRAGIRTLTLPTFALTALQHRRQFSSGGYLFHSQKGRVPTASDLRKRFTEACKRAGIKGATIHDLRRMHATLAIANGVDVKTVQRRLGHSSLAMTLGIYAQATAEGDAKAADVLDRLLTPKPAPDRPLQDEATGD
jgi:integrase